MRNVTSRRRGSDFAAGVGQELGNDSSHRRLQFQKAAFVKIIAIVVVATTLVSGCQVEDGGWASRRGA